MQPKFSELAIETSLMLRLVFHLPLRQTAGSVRSLFALMEVESDVPNHTTISRRSKWLAATDTPEINAQLSCGRGHETLKAVSATICGIARGV